MDAENIDVKTGFSWSNSSSLALNASFHIHIDSKIVSSAIGGIALTVGQTNGNTNLLFGSRGRVVFQDTSSAFSINGTAYTLVNDIASLASDIAANPSGSYALADNYDASGDGTYSESPITTIFTGIFEGLGNTISHLTIDHTGSRTGIGLFLLVFSPGAVTHVRLTHADISGTSAGEGDEVGALAGSANGAFFFQDSARGRIRLKGRAGLAGGLVGNIGPSAIDSCFATVTIDATRAKGGAEAGGLVGENVASVTGSFASGVITVGKSNRAGGLIGGNLGGPVENSYSDINNGLPYLLANPPPK